MPRAKDSTAKKQREHDDRFVDLDEEDFSSDDDDDDNQSAQQHRPSPGKIKRTRRVTKSRASGLTFPVGRLQRMLKDMNQGNHRVGVGSGIYLAAVLEYLCSEVLELAAAKVSGDRRARIKPRDIMEAVKKDEELDELMQNVEFADAGTMCELQPILTKKRSEWTSKDKASFEGSK